MDRKQAHYVVYEEFVVLWRLTREYFATFPLNPLTLHSILKDENRLLREAIWKLIENAYSAPSRFYHDLTHVAYGITVFWRFREFKELSPYQIMLFLWSWILHDIVNVPGGKDNERVSAELAKFFLIVLGAGERFAHIVYEIIVATATHQIPTSFSGTDEELFVLKLVLDVDLAAFGAPPEKFREQSEQLLQEALSERRERSEEEATIEFYKNRSAYFQGLGEMVNRDLFYKLDYFKKNFLPQATANIMDVLWET